MIHSLNSHLLGTPVKLLVNANVSANHKTATQCIQTCRHDQSNLLKFKPSSIRIRNKMVKVTLKVVWMMVPHRLVKVFQKLMIYWEFFSHLTVRITDNDHKKRTYSEWQSCGWKCLVDGRCQWRTATLLIWKTQLPRFSYLSEWVKFYCFL